MSFIRYNLLALAWSIVIIILCSIPGQEFPDTSFLDVPHLDKIVHFSLFFILSLVTIKGLYNQKASNLLAYSPYLFTIVYGIVLGIVLEFSQHYFIVYRTGDVYDVLANTSGSLLGALAIYYKRAPNYFLLDN